MRPSPKAAPPAGSGPAVPKKAGSVGTAGESAGRPPASTDTRPPATRTSTTRPPPISTMFGPDLRAAVEAPPGGDQPATAPGEVAAGGAVVTAGGAGGAPATSPAGATTGPVAAKGAGP